MPIPQEILLINEDYIKKFTPLTDAVDPNLIRPAIYLAQDKYLTNFLGTNLTVKLKADVAGGTLSGDYETLLNEYVLKVVLWWTVVELYPSLLYKHDNGNLVSRQSEDTTPVTKPEMISQIAIEGSCKAECEMVHKKNGGLFVFQFYFVS